MDVKDPTSFSQKHDMNLILLLIKWVNYFHLSEKLQLNMQVTSFLKKLSEKRNHLELKKLS